MKFTWDEVKRRTNLIRHGLDFARAEDVFRGVTFTFEDERFEYTDQRFITIGMLGSAVVVIAHNEWEDKVRVISMRQASRHEQHLYYRAFAEGWDEE
jgi:uncharacterized DUF497 family protein